MPLTPVKFVVNFPKKRIWLFAIFFVPQKWTVLVGLLERLILLNRISTISTVIYSVSHKIPRVFLTFFPNGWEFLDQILHTYYSFLCTLDCKFLSNYLQLWRSYAILSATTQFTPYIQNVHTISRNARWHFLIFSQNSWEFLVQILRTYYTFLSMLHYKFLFKYV